MRGERRALPSSPSARGQSIRTSVRWIDLDSSNPAAVGRIDLKRRRLRDSDLDRSGERIRLDRQQAVWPEVGHRGRGAFNLIRADPAAGWQRPHEVSASFLVAVADRETLDQRFRVTPVPVDYAALAPSIQDRLLGGSAGDKRNPLVSFIETMFSWWIPGAIRTVSPDWARSSASRRRTRRCTTSWAFRCSRTPDRRANTARSPRKQRWSVRNVHLDHLREQRERLPPSEMACLRKNGLRYAFLHNGHLGAADPGVQMLDPTPEAMGRQPLHH